jgi:hypothetical protein
MTNRNISEIAREILQTWQKPNFGAVPYLNAMKEITDINEKYYQDDARSVVLYFLSNATTWRGPDARRIKDELKAVLKESAS